MGRDSLSSYLDMIVLVLNLVDGMIATVDVVVSL